MKHFVYPGSAIDRLSSARGHLFVDRVLVFIGTLLLFAVSPIRANTLTPEQFAWQWPIKAGANEGILRLTLSADIYSQLYRSDLLDLAAFNANGEAIPFGPISQAWPTPVVSIPAPLSVPWFKVRQGENQEESLSLQIVRAADGRLRQLEAEIAGAPADTSRQDILLDLSTLKVPVEALDLTLDLAPGENLNTRVDIEGSEDLSNWRLLAHQVAIVSLQEGGFRLERRRLEFPPVRVSYLRLRRTDSGAALPLSAVRTQPAYARHTSVPIAQQTLTLMAEQAADDTLEAYVYSLPGPLPVESVNVTLADRNAVTSVVVLSREQNDRPWQERARFTAFRIGAGASEVSNMPAKTALGRDRLWQVRTEPAQARAPSLSVTYAPDQMLVITQGAAPFRLVAGSAVAVRDHYPLEALVGQARAAFGPEWKPPLATLGKGQPLAGESALAAPEPEPPWGQWLLWGILVMGAIMLVVMVLRLLREQSPPAGQ